MKTLMIGCALLAAAPALAQTPPPPGMDAPRGDRPQGMRGQRGQMFSSMTPEGRKTLGDAMRGQPQDREAIKAARDRINTLIAADKLDVPALKRSMDDERRLVDSQHAQRQTAMIAAFQKLTVADRKAFAEDARKGRERIEARTARLRDGAPPPPPPGE